MKHVSLGLAVVLAGFSVILFGSSASGADRLWTLDGFANPEAVLAATDGAVLYVSNTNGPPAEKNNAGYISLISPEGELLEEKWATDLNAPKGMVLNGDRLFVSDVDRLVAIDVADGKLVGEWRADGAVYLNGLTVDDRGRVYVSDTLESAIFRLEGDTFEVWVDSEQLDYPNGLRFDDGRILVAGWGKPKPDYTTDVPGHLKAVDIDSREIVSVSNGEPIGNLDGIKRDGDGWLATDFMAGSLVSIDAKGESRQLLDLDPGSADLEFIASERIAVVPMFMDGKVVAYHID